MLNPVDNATFVSTLFQGCDDGAVPVVCSFPGDPQKADRSDWSAKPVLTSPIPAAIRRPEKLNTYLAVSAFRRGEDGKFHRRKADFAALHTVMMDDLGTGPGAKLPLDALMRLDRGATALIETSPKNYQAWVRLDPPITDLDTATRLIDSLIRQGLMAETDPGMSGVTRYGRLPVGINGKAKYLQNGQPWPVSLAKWNPVVSYSLADMAEAFGLDLAAAAGSKTRESIQIDPGQDPYLAMLNRLGVVKAQRGNVYDISCPWRDSHTGGADTGAAYLSPTGFKCHHGHCQKRNFSDLKCWLQEQGFDIQAADMDLLVLKNPIPPESDICPAEDAMMAIPPTPAPDDNVIDFNSGNAKKKRRQKPTAAPDGNQADPADSPNDNPQPGRAGIIKVEPGMVPEMADQAEKMLLHGESTIFQRTGELVRCVIGKAETVHGIDKPGGIIEVISLEPDYLYGRLNRMICWQKLDKRAGRYVNVNAPRTVVNELLTRRGEWQANPLVAVVNTPTLRPDGSVLDRPGYDRTTGLLYVRQDHEVYNIPQEPSEDQARDALDTLSKVISGFTFAEPCHKSAALSAILTATVRRSLRTAPMHTYSAPRMSCGKTLLADVAALVSTGQVAVTLSFTDDDAEMQKRVLTILLSGYPVINLDNIPEGIPLLASSLNSVLTQTSFTGRLLGGLRSGTAPTCCLWQATGNSLQIAGDMTTRVVPCVLDPKCERPEEREFPINLYDWIPANRPALVTAALTVLRAYVVAGRPPQDIKNFARFEDWSGWVRSALVWLGEPDPLAGREQIVIADPVGNKIRHLMLAWYEAFQDRKMLCREVVQAAQKTTRDERGSEIHDHQALHDALQDYLADRNGNIKAKALGDFLSKYKNRVEIGARFETDGISHHAMMWQLKIIDPERFAKILERPLTDSPNSPNSPAKDGIGEFGEFGEVGESVAPRSGKFADVQTVINLFSGAPGSKTLTFGGIAKALGIDDGEALAMLNQLEQDGILERTHPRMNVYRRAEPASKTMN